MQELRLPVKNKRGEVVKEVIAYTPQIYLGTIMNLMELLEIGDDISGLELLKKVSNAWKEVKEILSDIFPEMEEEDWEYIRLNDLIPIILQVVRYTFAEIMTIPSDSKK